MDCTEVSSEMFFLRCKHKELETRTEPDKFEVCDICSKSLINTVYVYCKKCGDLISIFEDVPEEYYIIHFHLIYSGDNYLPWRDVELRICSSCFNLFKTLGTGKEIDYDLKQNLRAYEIHKHGKEHRYYTTIVGSLKELLSFLRYDVSKIIVHSEVQKSLVEKDLFKKREQSDKVEIAIELIPEVRLLDMLQDTALEDNQRDGHKLELSISYMSFDNLVNSIDAAVWTGLEYTYVPDEVTYAPCYKVFLVHLRDTNEYAIALVDYYDLEQYLRKLVTYQRKLNVSNTQVSTRQETDKHAISRFDR